MKAFGCSSPMLVDDKAAGRLFTVVPFFLKLAAQRVLCSPKLRRSRGDRGLLTWMCEGAQGCALRCGGGLVLGVLRGRAEAGCVTPPLLGPACVVRVTGW